MSIEFTKPAIRIAAALAVDANGRLLLVRKRGTSAFMQPGGKIEPGEEPVETLRRELMEELGLVVDASSAIYVGRFSAPAANESGSTVEAEIFRVLITQIPVPAAEIEDAVWVDVEQAKQLVLAPLTRDHLLPLTAGAAELRSKN